MYYYTDPTLQVHNEVPAEGTEINFNGSLKSWREALDNPAILGYPYYYHCWNCNGYIQGLPSTFSKNTLGPLCGRKGTSYCCLRCGLELDFQGIIS